MRASYTGVIPREILDFYVLFIPIERDRFGLVSWTLGAWGFFLLLFLVLFVGLVLVLFYRNPD